jgi:hypothetical protein
MWRPVVATLALARVALVPIDQTTPGTGEPDARVLR